MTEDHRTNQQTGLSLVDDEVSTAEALMWVLEHAGIDMVFGIPGGETLPIHRALIRSSRLHPYRPGT